MPDIVLYETRGRIGLITLNRPEARNAVNGDVAAGVEAAIDQLESDDEVWVGIITANTEGQERPVFSAGADLKAINSGQAASLNTKRGGFAGFVYRERTKPVIVAVDGLATAGGCEIVLAADLVVATTRSSFGLAEAKRNLVAGAGGLFRLPRAIGRAAAMEAILTGEPIPAERAYALGLVSRLVEPGQAVEEALALAAKICENAPLAIWESRKVVLAADHADVDTLMEMTNAAMRVVMGSEDLKEGLAAFVEKRPPQWSGRWPHPPASAGPTTPCPTRTSTRPGTAGGHDATSATGTQPTASASSPGTACPPFTVTRKSRITKWWSSAMRSTQPRNGPHVPVSPVSSCSSRSTAAASVSPGSTRPPGTLHDPTPGPLPRCTSSSRRPS